MQIIASEFLSYSIKSMEKREVKLRTSLRSIGNLTEEQIEDVVNRVIVDDDMLKAQKHLNTDYKCSKYIVDNFKYVAPRELILNPEDVEMGRPKEVHYVPVIESFKNILEDQTFMDVLENVEAPDNVDSVIRDIKDGSVIQILTSSKKTLQHLQPFYTQMH